MALTSGTALAQMHWSLLNIRLNFIVIYYFMAASSVQAVDIFFSVQGLRLLLLSLIVTILMHTRILEALYRQALQ